MDEAAVAKQFMRALRGKRSQTAFSRLLGYSTNVAYGWESGRRSPTVREAFRAATRVGIDVRAALSPFFQGKLPDALAAAAPASKAFVAALLSSLRGTVSMDALASATGLSRSAVSRVLGGRTEPRLPFFFSMVSAMSRRLLDLIAGFVDVSTLPAARDEWRRVEALRRLALENPLSEAVPRFLELDAYAALPRHRAGWIAERLGIPLVDEERTLRDLRAAGVIRWDGVRWRLDRERSIDTTRSGPRAASVLRQHWTDEASRRIRGGADGLYGYLVFSTDDDTLAAIRDLRLKFFRDLRALVAGSPKNDRVAVATVHLFPIDIGGVAADVRPGGG